VESVSLSPLFYISIFPKEGRVIPKLRNCQLGTNMSGPLFLKLTGPSHEENVSSERQWIEEKGGADISNSQF
jgi:hypothetical protein